jgi:hypothetical protein
MKIHLILLRALAAILAFGSFAWCLGLIGEQLYRWARDGAWPGISTSDGLISLVTSCCVRADGAGRMADIGRWLESPASWIGLHRVIELVPASISLFLLSVCANFIYIYCSDQLAVKPRAPGAPGV